MGLEAKGPATKPASAQAEAGNVKLLKGKKAFFDEVCSLPYAQFGDQVDAFADALNELALVSTFTLQKL